MTEEKSPVARTGSDGQRSSLHFVSHLADRFWGRPHEPHPGVGAGLREVGPLREETVAWVDGVHVIFLNGKQSARLTFAWEGEWSLHSTGTPSHTPSVQTNPKKKRYHYQPNQSSCQYGQIGPSLDH